jgi:hypothetical protein
LLLGQPDFFIGDLVLAEEVVFEVGEGASLSLHSLAQALQNPHAGQRGRAYAKLSSLSPEFLPLVPRKPNRDNFIQWLLYLNPYHRITLIPGIALLNILYCFISTRLFSSRHLSIKSEIIFQRPAFLRPVILYHCSG